MTLRLKNSAQTTVNTCSSLYLQHKECTHYALTPLNNSDSDLEQLSIHILLTLYFIYLTLCLGIDSSLSEIPNTTLSTAMIKSTAHTPEPQTEGFFISYIHYLLQQNFFL